MSQDLIEAPSRNREISRREQVAYSIEEAIERHNLLVEFTKSKLMVEGPDYGVLPGTVAKDGEKPKKVLLKPGAEKLASFFRLVSSKPEIIEKVEDWTGENHGGEPFFYYLICQTLTRNGEVVASQMGSCNSWEKKYRYRTQERSCPECNQPAIKRSKYPPRDDPHAEPGWYCYAKIGGCGANFYAGDERIEEQQAGKVPNPDVADLTNTILKMAQKRALVAAVLVATNASEFFTQDVEDMEIIDADYEPAKSQPARQESRPAKNGNGANRASNMPKTGDELKERLRRYDETLTAQGIILRGDLVKYIERSIQPATWGELSPEAIAKAVDLAKAFEQERRNGPPEQKEPAPVTKAKKPGPKSKTLMLLHDWATKMQLTPTDREELCSQAGVNSFEELSEENAQAIITDLRTAHERKQKGEREPGEEPYEPEEL